MENEEQEEKAIKQDVYADQEKTETNGMGIAGFILSIITFFLWWIPFIGIILWILSLTFSIIGLSKQPKGLSIAGLVISCVIFIPLIVLLVIGLSLFRHLFMF